MLELIDVGVVGTAGRGKDVEFLTAVAFAKMCAHFKSLIHDQEQQLPPEYHWNMCISGGAAGADAIALVAMNEGWIRSLTLVVPGHFDVEKKVFVSTVNGKKIAYDRDVQTANYYYSEFKKRTDIDLGKLMADVVKLPGVKVESYYNFYQRNMEIARRARVLVAYTFGQDEPGSSGTMSTWKAHQREGNGVRRHYNIKEL